MKLKENKLRAAFAPETRFELRPTPSAPFRATGETEFERLKLELLARQLARTGTPDLNTPVRRAANEAAALAWNTLFPLLVFPALFEEKVAEAVRHARRQAKIYAATREMALAA
jgi:hypothetical protein